MSLAFDDYYILIRFRSEVDKLSEVLLKLNIICSSLRVEGYNYNVICDITISTEDDVVIYVTKAENGDNNIMIEKVTSANLALTKNKWELSIEDFLPQLDEMIEMNPLGE